MPPSPDHILSDARLISAYAATHGLLGQSKLLEAITSSSEALSRNAWTIDIEKSLLEEIDKTSLAIRPISLEQLKSDSSNKLNIIKKQLYFL